MWKYADWSASVLRTIMDRMGVECEGGGKACGWDGKFRNTGGRIEGPDRQLLYVCTSTAASLDSLLSIQERSTSSPSTWPTKPNPPIPILSTPCTTLTHFRPPVRVFSPFLTHQYDSLRFTLKPRPLQPELQLFNFSFGAHSPSTNRALECPPRRQTSGKARHRDSRRHLRPALPISSPSLARRRPQVCKDSSQSQRDGSAARRRHQKRRHPSHVPGCQDRRDDRRYRVLPTPDRSSKSQVQVLVPASEYFSRYSILHARATCRHAGENYEPIFSLLSSGDDGVKPFRH